jgi:hypothetical protein
MVEFINMLNSLIKVVYALIKLLVEADVFERKFFDFIMSNIFLLHTFAVNILVRSFTTIDRV